MKRFVKLMCLIILLCYIGNVSYGQRIVTYGIQVNPGTNWLNCNTPKGLSGFTYKGSFGVNIGLAGSYYLNKKVAISTGIQLYKYGFNLSGSEYNFAFISKDSEDKEYERRVSGTNIIEKTSLNLMHIPICLMYDHQVNTSFHLFIMAGPSLYIPLKTQMEASGEFTYKGYYADGKYLLEDLPVYGFNSNVPVKVNGKLKSQMFSVHGLASVGCFFYINRYWKFSTSVTYLRSFSSISEKLTPDYYLSNEVGSYYSILKNQGSVLSGLSFGISIQKILMF